MYEDYSKIRDSLGLTDYAVAKGAGIGRSTLSDWKSGAHTPNPQNMKKIADFLGVSVDYLMTGRGYYYSEETAAKAQELFENPSMRILFDAARGSRPEDLQMAADLLSRLKETNPDG